MQLLNKHTATAEERKGAVYIGRGSPLGNPYVIGEHGEREKVIEDYRRYLAQKLFDRDPEIEKALRALTLDSKLLCYCTPRPCHGTVIQEYWNALCYQGDYEANLTKFRHSHSLLQIDYLPEDDGKTHINVWSMGKTELGRLLSNFAHTPFDHYKYGHFASVEAFWYWLCTGKKHQELRSLHGFDAKKVGRALAAEAEQGGIPVIIDHFQCEIKSAILAKIDQNSKVKAMLKASTLPLSHYYVWGKSPDIRVTYPKQHAWTFQYLELCREWLNGRAQKLVIAGSRSIKQYEIVKKAYIESDFNAVEIVSGMAPGVDRLGEDLAHELQLPIREFPADWDTHKKAAGFIRNEEMAQYADACLIVWDGQSNGTQDMENRVAALSKPYITVRTA